MEALVEANLTQKPMNCKVLEEQTTLLRAELNRHTAAVAYHSRINHRQFILKLMEADDIEAYLQAFEGTSVREGRPMEQWASLLAPFL